MVRTHTLSHTVPSLASGVARSSITVETLLSSCLVSRSSLLVLVALQGHFGWRFLPSLQQANLPFSPSRVLWCLLMEPLPQPSSLWSSTILLWVADQLEHG